MWREMESENEPSFTVDDEPKIMLNPVDFDNSFVSVPFVGVEVHRRNELERNIIKQGSELPAPVGDGDVRYFNIIQHFEDESNITSGIFTDEVHGESGKYTSINADVSRVTHTFEIVFADEF